MGEPVLLLREPARMTVTVSVRRTLGGRPTCCCRRHECAGLRRAQGWDLPVSDVVLDRSRDVFAYQAAGPSWTGNRNKVVGWRGKRWKPDLAFPDKVNDLNPEVWPSELRLRNLQCKCPFPTEKYQYFYSTDAAKTRSKRRLGLMQNGTSIAPRNFSDYVDH